MFPRAAELARESRQFQRRAVAYAAQAGVRQFIDLGCGLPTVPSTHETARAIQPDATVVYVDNDEQVLTHAQNILARTEGVLAVAGDLGLPRRDPLRLAHPAGGGLLPADMRAHDDDLAFLRRRDGPPDRRPVHRRYPYGSYVIVSVGSSKARPANSSPANTAPGSSTTTARMRWPASWTASNP